MKKIYVWMLMLFTFVGVSAQTTIISPTGAGGFELGSTFAANGWTATNSSINPWVLGPLSNGAITGNAAFVSSDGTTPSYTNNATCSNYFWRDVTIPAGETNIRLSFNWICTGESTLDLWQVFVAPTTVTPVATTAYPGSGANNVPTGIAGATWVGNGNLQSTIQTATMFLPASAAGTTVRLIFHWKNDGSVGSLPAQIDNISLVSSLPGTIIATATGGPWSSPATWVGGVFPAPADNAVIPAGSTVIVDQVTTANNITVNGTLHWGATSFALNAINNLEISATGRLLPYTTGRIGQTVNIGGNFTNNGYANLSTSAIVFNGSMVGSSMAQTMSGSGVFQGNTNGGLVSGFLVSTLGTVTINTTQNIYAHNTVAAAAGTLITNGKLFIDNTQTIFGTPFNQQVANIAMTNIGAAYSTAPLVFGAAATLWTTSGAATINTRYFSGNNVYLATTAGAFDAATAPTHTTGSVTNGTVPLLWIGTIGTLGNPFIATATVVGTQYFYGNNLYVCTVAGIPSITAPPTHTTGAVASGAATFLYVGTPATATLNYDATTQTVRSVNITNVGSGYSVEPSIAFLQNGGTVTTAATATAVVFQSVAGPTFFLMQKGSAGTITGGLTINSTQNATSFSGVGSVHTTGGGVNYTAAPIVGFSGPTAINLITNAGSGYTTAPTVTVTGGTLVSGTPLATTNFLIVVAQGRVVSVFLTGNATYSVPPTLAITGGGGSGATLEFPAGSWPTATATVGANGQITNFTVTNAGFGYNVAPTVGLSNVAGTFTTAATAPTARIGLYNLTIGFFAPAVASVVNNEGAEVPSNRRINNLNMNNPSGANFTGNLSLISNAPLTFTNGIANFGTNTLSCESSTFGGATGSITSNINGTIRLNTPGGSVTRTFPFDAAVALATGTGSLDTGSIVTSITASRTAAPTGTVTPSGMPTGTRAYRLIANTGAIYGTNPTVTLNFNGNDPLVADNASLFIAQSTALSGPWTNRSVNTLIGPLPATGSRITATTTPGPVVFTGNDFFAWTSTIVAIQSAQTGNWNAPTTWVGGVVPPPSCQDVFINSGHTVTVNNNGNNARNVTILTGGALTISSGSLTVGCVDNNNAFVNNGTFTMANGVLTVSGSFTHNLGSTFNHSDGEIIVDGNSGTLASSVTGSIVQLNSQFINWTGGLLTILDPHFGTGNAITYTNSIAHVNVTGNHTLQFGDALSNTAGGTNGFRISSFASSRRISFNNINIDALSIGNTNRFVSALSDLTINGDLTINSNSELRLTAPIHLSKNIVNEGKFVSTATVAFERFLDGIASSSPNAQTISGSGLFENNATAANITGNLVNLNVDNSNATGVTLLRPLSVTGTLTLISGFINTTDTNLLTVGTPTALGTVSGGNATAYVKGPIKRFFGNANSAFQLFPVGAATYKPIWLNPTTTAVGSSMRARAFDTNAGTANPSITALSTTSRWEAPIDDASAGITNVRVRVSGTTLTSNNLVVQAPTAGGQYNSAFGPLSTFAAGTPNTVENQTPLASANYTGFLSFAELNPCAGTPTPGNTISTATTICNGQTITLSIQNIPVTIGNTYQWQSSPDGVTYTNIAAATLTSFTVAPTAVTFYRCTVTCANGGASALSTPLQITYVSSITSTTPATRCGPGIVNLAASGTGTNVFWYDVPTGGSLLMTGNNFSPNVTTTKTFFAQSATQTAGTVTVGNPGSTTATTGVTPFSSNFEGNRSQYLFTAAELSSRGISPGAITSLGFTVTASGTGTFAQSGFNIKVAQVTDTSLTDFLNPTFTNVFGPVTEPAPAIGNKIYTFSSPFIWNGTSSLLIEVCHDNDINNSCANCFSGNSTVAATSTAPVNTVVGRFLDNGPACGVAGGTASQIRPNIIFNAQVACLSPRVPVVATVTTPPAFSLASNTTIICSGATSAPITIATGASDYNTYVWNPATGVTGNATTGWTFSATANTTYTLTASQSAGNLCSATATVTVTVNPIPTPIVVTPSAPSVCVNNIQILTATGGTLSASGKVGSGTAANTESTPFLGFWGGQRTQALYTAAELTALGMLAGQSINSIGYVALSGTPLVLNSFTISAGFVTVTTLGTNFIAGATNVVLPPTNYTPTTGIGNLDFPLSTPLVWDGVSNLLVDTCFNNNNGGGTSANSISVESSTVPTGLNLRRFQDNIIDVCTNTALVSTATNRPNLRVTASQNIITSWSPITNLFTDAAATIPYVANANANTVYVKSATAATTAYTVSATTTANCSRTATFNVVVNPLPTVVTVAQTVCAPGTVNLTAAAVTAGSSTGLTFTYFTDLAGTLAYATPAAATAGTYFIRGTNANGCSAITPVVVTVNPLPNVVTVAPAAVCAPGTVNLTLPAVTAGSTAGLTFTYFTDMAATIPYATPTAAVAGTYYIRGTTASGCSSVAPVVVTVTQTTGPTGNATQSFCSVANITQLVATGTGIKWYDAPTGGNLLPTITAIGLTNGSTYYASQTINGCESTTRLAVTVTITPLVTPIFTQVAPICSGATLAALPTTANGITGTWSPALNNTVTTTYTFTPTAGQCATQTTMTIVVNPLASTPTGNATQSFSVPNLNDATINSLIVSPSSVVWYSTLANAQAGTNPIAAGTVITNGSTYFAVNVSGGCPSLPFAVTVTVTLGSKEFDLKSFVAYPNPVIDVLNMSYSSEMTNVKVHNMLGQVVITKNINSKEAQIDLSGIEAGTYFVDVTSNDTVHTFKVIKK